MSEISIDPKHNKREVKGLSIKNLKMEYLKLFESLKIKNWRPNFVNLTIELEKRKPSYIDLMLSFRVLSNHIAPLTGIAMNPTLDRPCDND